eukprot:GFYU01009532.1.p1 GENE.GFYU01009532.1~~GFYU01009532.1.p1  ORF type:complete len:428 (-),score=99.11 GFYU01009532.1:20-1303(-)
MNHYHLPLLLVVVLVAVAGVTHVEGATLSTTTHTRLGLHANKSSSYSYSSSEYSEEYSDDGEEEVAVTVMTDVDDTLYCSGGGLGGADTQYPKHTFYPGVEEFYLAMSRGPRDLNTPKAVVVLTARPREMKSVLAINEAHEIPQSFSDVWSRELGREIRPVDIERVQYGKIADNVMNPEKELGRVASRSRNMLVRTVGKVITMGVIAPMPVPAPRAMKFRWYGKTKAEGYEEAHAEDPSGEYVFVGDNGQGDELAGRALVGATNEEVGLDSSYFHALKHTTPPCKAIFIHDVRPPPGNGNDNFSPFDRHKRDHTGVCPADTDYPQNLRSIRKLKTMPPPDGEVHGRPFIYFRTYTEAAVKAHRIGLISEHGLMSVVEGVKGNAIYRECKEEATEAERISQRHDDLSAKCLDLLYGVKLAKLYLNSLQ